MKREAKTKERKRVVRKRQMLKESIFCAAMSWYFKGDHRKVTPDMVNLWNACWSFDKDPDA
ncbi:MAG: hypothetical protein EPN91_08150 [Salinibacterium sp.]|nr:MAG: hypothetical protein EPN91_08150 [Salinibacterium sp.]